MKTHIHVQAHTVKCGNTHKHTCIYAHRAKYKGSGREWGKDGEIRMKSEKMNSRIISLISQDLTEKCSWDGWSPWKNRAYSPPPAPLSPIPPKSSSRPGIQTGLRREAERERKSKSIPIGLVIKSPSFPRNPLWEVSEESLKEKNTVLNLTKKATKLIKKSP